MVDKGLNKQYLPMGKCLIWLGLLRFQASENGHPRA
jgi:hypothetical protein